ncbi:outer membrane protein OmpA [Accumulibacter sp.]|uniref:outer membrane protein OmpA n=1 Tax=Accumulibacter sp. TaxID=2053492 RepID=UPI0025D691A8|nr:OmpA family protein [Accumulibacter sp.]MCM8596101.1 OmpA family protein [Accumulibacter sp.]MCM8626998.1 OmpA family protein [Accumulibacter sp.]MDS4050250.1 OmpA family protein [Accumulibacter sp.]
MKSTIITTLLASIGLFAAAGAVRAQTAGDRVYVIDQRGEVVLSGTGLCWRTGFWTPAAAAKDPAGCKCDKDLLPKEVCEPPVAQATPPVAKPSGDKITIAADALFDFDKATLRPEGKKRLDEVAAKSKEIKLEVIIAVGHTDRIGSDAYNLKLSDRRAASVKQYLVSKGIDANRIYTEGKGERNPVTGDKCKNMGPETGKNKKLVECLQPDRRVDIELIGTK